MAEKTAKLMAGKNRDAEPVTFGKLSIHDRFRFAAAPLGTVYRKEARAHYTIAGRPPLCRISRDALVIPVPDEARDATGTVRRLPSRRRSTGGR